MKRSCVFFFLFALSASSLTGCGKFFSQFSRQNNASTSVQFTRGSTPSLHERGLMRHRTAGLWCMPPILRAPSPLALSLANDTDPTVFQLPNGTYTFKAVGWANHNFGGPPNCGYNTNGAVSLQGGSAVVSIALIGAGEGGSPCGNSDFGNALPPLQFAFCDDLVASSAGRPPFTLTTACSGGYESMRFFSGSNPASGSRGWRALNTRSVNVTLDRQRGGSRALHHGLYRRSIHEKYSQHHECPQRAQIAKSFVGGNLIPGRSAHGAAERAPTSSASNPVFDGGFIPGTDYVVYTQQTGTASSLPVLELLFSSPSLGLRGFKINNPVSGGNGIVSFAVAKSTDVSGNPHYWVAFASEQTANGVADLFLADLTNIQSGQLHTSLISPGSCASSAQCNGVPSTSTGSGAVQFSSDGTKLIYLGAFSGLPLEYDLYWTAVCDPVITAGCNPGASAYKLDRRIAGLAAHGAGGHGASSSASIKIMRSGRELLGDPNLSLTDARRRILSLSALPSAIRQAGI